MIATDLRLLLLRMIAVNPREPCPSHVQVLTVWEPEAHPFQQTDTAKLKPTNSLAASATRTPTWRSRSPHRKYPSAKFAATLLHAVADALIDNTDVRFTA
jgi:hypothetical protein